MLKNIYCEINYKPQTDCILQKFTVIQSKSQIGQCWLACLLSHQLGVCYQWAALWSLHVMMVSPCKESKLVRSNVKQMECGTDLHQDVKVRELHYFNISLYNHYFPLCDKICGYDQTFYYMHIILHFSLTFIFMMLLKEFIRQILKKNVKLYTFVFNLDSFFFSYTGYHFTNVLNI